MNRLSKHNYIRCRFPYGWPSGELTWDRVVFPKFPLPLLPSDIGVMISRRNPVVNHVSTMRRVGDDVLLLTGECKVVIHHNPSEADVR